MESKLDRAREIINSVDKQMAELFVKRMKAAELVFEHKKEFGLPILDTSREEKVIETNSKYVSDIKIRGYYIDFLKNVMRVSRAYQYRMQEGIKVAYSGVEGAFASIAASRIFPDAVRVSHTDFKAAYDSVVNGECDVAVLPIENSYAGEVGQTIDLLFSGTLYINGIYALEIHQNLLGVKGAKLEDIKEVTSHSQALSQCHEYIKSHGFKAQQATNTAIAAKSVAASGDRSVGAIASEETAALYGLDIIERNINKSNENTTRFAVVSRIKAKSPSLSNSVIMFTVKNEAGSLCEAISIIGKYKYNMTALRSRPMKKHSWQYYFYIEIDGITDTADGQKMIEELKGVCDKLKIVGTFAPNAEI